jgi:large subunit ribosomal protein L31
MKAEIHPEVREVIFKDTTNGAMYKMLSAVKSRETIDVEGVTYPLVRADVTASSHPFYTGKQRILDTAGRVEKFGNKFGKSVAALSKKKPKPA